MYNRLSTLFGLTLSISFIKAHNHQVIFLVEESRNIRQQECNKQQEGINDYFQFFHDLQANNTLSYFTFNGFGNINKIINFVEDENYIPFDNILNKIKSVSCTDNLYNCKNTNNFNSLNNALKLSLSMFNIYDKRTPRILLFNHFNKYSYHNISISNCLNQMKRINNLL
eukprot:78055_1